MNKIDFRKLLLEIDFNTKSLLEFNFNCKDTREKFTLIVENILRNRGYNDSVICDETNNTPDIIDKNSFVFQVDKFKAILVPCFFGSYKWKIMENNETD